MDFVPTYYHSSIMTMQLAFYTTYIKDIDESGTF